MGDLVSELEMLAERLQAAGNLYDETIVSTAAARLDELDKKIIRITCAMQAARDILSRSAERETGDAR
jgi:hypothetical protein